MLGLSSLLIAAEMPQTIQNNYGTIMKVLVFLSSKSVEIYEKSMQQKEKQEQCDEDEDGIIVEDEEFDGIDIDLDDDEDEDDWDGSDDEYEGKCLYDSPLDQVNEIIFFHEKMNALQTTHTELYNYLVG